MKRIILLAVMVCTLIFLAGPASAVSLTLLPSYQEIIEGQTASVDLVVGDLGNSAAPSLGSWSLDITYDPSILSNTGVTFGTQLSPSFQSAISSPGQVSLFEASFLVTTTPTPSLLDLTQPGSFLLATLDFMGIGVGTSGLSITNPFLGDSHGIAYFDINITGPNDGFSVGVAPVPEPATMLLLGAGLAGLAGFRRKFKKA